MAKYIQESGGPWLADKTISLPDIAIMLVVVRHFIIRFHLLSLIAANGEATSSDTTTTEFN